MRAHYLQHVPFEGLGYIETWLRKAGYEITSTEFYKNEILPSVHEFDLLIVMGGSMSVNDENVYPWLVDEKRFIKSAIDSGTPTLGICLGAQLLASVMGGKVYPNSQKEIGWFPVQAVSSSNAVTFSFPKVIDVFHWHGETFSLPPNAFRIAESIACENQAFQIGDRIIGIQFHLETTFELIQALVANSREELVEGEYIQTEERILSAPPERYASINGLMDTILEYLHQKAANGTHYFKKGEENVK